MLDFGFYNMDCMQGMSEFPDKYFDLAIVDPPYGDGGGTWKRTDKSRFGGVFDKYKAPSRMRAQEGRQSTELVEPGRRSSEKNCRVGCSAWTGIL